MEAKATHYMVVSTSKEQTRQIARAFAKTLKKGDLVAIFGELGSGKTVFVQGIAEGLNIKKRITSPTFVFMRTYPLQLLGQKINFCHLDLYRGEAKIDYGSLGLSEIINGKNVVVLEWASKIKDRLPKKRIDVTIEAKDERTRRITIRANK